jgi:transcriptional regulator with XRE-family HTH domain
MAGRPPKPLGTDAPPAAARLGVELRQRRVARGLTLAELGARSGYSPQHLSSLELAATGATSSCVAALDAALDAGGALSKLLPAAIAERLTAADCRAAARRRYDEDVDPTNRRGLLSGTAGAALGAAALGPAPVAAREIDPELPAHWIALLAVLGAADDAHGPREILEIARRELRLIAEHRTAARGALRAELMRVESRWATHAGWLCEDAGDRRGRATLLDHALHLAREAGYPDVMAWARARQAQWSDAPRAVRLAQTALRTPHATPQARVLCATRAAHAHARVGDSEAAERMIAEAERLATQESRPAPLSRNLRHNAEHDVRCWEARCWGALAPAKAIGLYEGVLRDWPRGEARDGGLFRARLATACAAAGELDRARAEGRKALATAKQTRSASTARELKQLGAVLSAA